MSFEPALFRFLPRLASSTPWVRLADRTPVGRLAVAGKRWRHGRLFVKREDRTAPCTEEIKCEISSSFSAKPSRAKVSRVLTVAPLGSNFVAALAAQARRVGLDVEVEHFVPARSQQIDTHANFSAAAGAKLSLHAGRRGAVAAAGAAALRLVTSKDTLWCAPGGSSVTGALGHLTPRWSSSSRFARERSRSLTPLWSAREPAAQWPGLPLACVLRDSIRDLLAFGAWIASFATRAIAKLANGVLARVGVGGRVRADEICLVKSPLDNGYGIALGRVEELMASFEADEGIRLDQRQDPGTGRSTRSAGGSACAVEPNSRTAGAGAAGRARASRAA
jgi:hypothetical protein